MSANGTGEDGEVELEVNKYFQYIVQFTFGSVLFVASVLIIAAVLSHEKLRKRKELLFLAGLAFGDLCFGLAALLSGSRRALLTLNEQHTIAVSPWYCMLVPTTLPWFISYYVRGAMMVVISIDRFLAIEHFNWWRVSNKQYPKTVAWIVGGHTLVCLLVAHAASYSIKDAAATNILCHSFWAVPQWYNYYAILFPLFSGYLSVAIYGLVIVAFRKKKSAVAPSNESAQLKQRAQQRRFTKTVGIVVLFTLVGNCSLYTLIFFMNFFIDNKQLFDRVIPVMGAGDMVNSMVNIAVYCLRVTEIRAAVIDVLHLRVTSIANINTGINTQK